MSEDWKHVKIDGIAKIERRVAEFEIREQEYSPYSQFDIKIYEGAEGSFTGVSNMQVKDQSGNAECLVGHGATIEEALTDTLQHFFELVSWKDAHKWEEEDYEWTNPFDF
jgi:hypothetical protein